MLPKKENLHKEIIRMLSISDFGKSKINSSKTLNTPKRVLKEDFIEDITDVFTSDENDKNFFTSGPKTILTIEMKAAMLAHSFNEYQAGLIGIYSNYNPYTKGSSQHEPGNLVNHPSVEKVRGINKDFNDLKQHEKDANIHRHGRKYKDEWKEIVKTFRVPATFTDSTIDTKEMSSSERGYIEKWWNKKSYSLIAATEGGLTELGRAQLEFLARAYTGKPADEKEELLFNILKDNGGHFSEVAENIIRDFYTLVMIPYIMNLTKRAKYNPKDFQLKLFIEKGINHALNQLPAYYDPQKGNLGSFIITVVKNNVINQLKEISEYKLDTGYLYDYLSSLHNPITIQSILNPEEAEGNYDEVKLLKKGGVINGKNVNNIYGYVYNNPMDALQDLTKDARSGGKPSPLAKHYIAGSSKSMFYKSFPPNYNEIADVMDLHDINPYEKYNIFQVNKLPNEAKQEIMKTLQGIISVFTSDYQKYGVKNINSFIKSNNDFVLKLMFELLNYGEFVEVYTRTWVIKNPQGGMTKIAPLQPVKFINTKQGQKEYTPDVNGKTPGENDTTWVWSSGQKSEEEIKNSFMNKFLAKMSQQKTDSQKPIPIEFTKNGQDIVNKIYSALRYYFGYQGKNTPVIKQNRDQLNILLKNYSNALTADETLKENSLTISNIFQNILK